MDDLRARLSEFDRALADALDVDVSPDFVARVRTRIAREPQPVRAWHAWRLALPLAAATVIAAAAVALLRAPVTPTAPLSARTLRLEPLAPAEPRMAARPPVSFAAPASAPLTEKTMTIAAAAPAVTAEPEVLVPREEIEMYRRLIAAAQAVKGPARVEVWTRAAGEPSMSAIQIDPIRIERIAPSVDGEGDRRW